MVCPYNGLLFGNKKEWHCIMDEPYKHYAKWKKPVTENHILHDSINIYVKYTEKANSLNRKETGGAEDWTVRGKWGVTASN